jgi:hypothetical protein
VHVDQDHPQQGEAPENVQTPHALLGRSLHIHPWQGDG